MVFWFNGNLINMLILQTCGSFHGLMLFKGKHILLRHAMGVTACTSRVWFSHDEVLDLKNFSNPCSKPPFCFVVVFFKERTFNEMKYDESEMMVIRRYGKPFGLLISSTSASDLYPCPELRPAVRFGRCGCFYKPSQAFGAGSFDGLKMIRW